MQPIPISVPTYRYFLPFPSPLSYRFFSHMSEQIKQGIHHCATPIINLVQNIDRQCLAFVKRLVIDFRAGDISASGPAVFSPLQEADLVIAP
jgi:hypothetical protein